MVPTYARDSTHFLWHIFTFSSGSLENVGFYGDCPSAENVLITLVMRYVSDSRQAFIGFAALLSKSVYLAV